MLLSSLNTGNTDLRETEVQHPNTAATLSLVMSSRAFSANSGQFEAGSTTTASSFLPSRPPFLFCSSINMSMTSFSVVSLIAMVPESEWRMPTLMVSCALVQSVAARLNASPAVATRKCLASGRVTTAAMDVCIAVSFCSMRGKRRKAACRDGIASRVPSRNDGVNHCAVAPIRRGRPRFAGRGGRTCRQNRHPPNC
jgi:hypothetical protein